MSSTTTWHVEHASDPSHAPTRSVRRWSGQGTGAARVCRSSWRLPAVGRRAGSGRTFELYVVFVGHLQQALAQRGLHGLHGAILVVPKGDSDPAAGGRAGARARGRQLVGAAVMRCAPTATPSAARRVATRPTHCGAHVSELVGAASAENPRDVGWGCAQGRRLASQDVAPLEFETAASFPSSGAARRLHLRARARAREADMPDRSCRVCRGSCVL